MNDTDMQDRNIPRLSSTQSHRKTCHLTVFSTVVIAIYLAAKIFLVYHAAKKTNRVIEVNNNNGGVIVDETLEQQSAPLDSSNQHKKLFPVSDFNCSSSYLGLPPRVAAKCRMNKALSSQSTEFDCSQLTCSSLLHGHPFRTRDIQLYQAAAKFFPDQSEMEDAMKEHDNQTIKLKHADLDVVRQLQSTTLTSCKSFLISEGFVNRVDIEAEDFPVAYSLLLHADAQQVVRLLRAIYRPNNVYCLHIDRKSTYQFWSSIQALATCFDNVQVVSNPVKIVYQGFSRLLADINCMKDLVASKVQWKYLINTAGQAFPLRTVEETVKILKIYNGSNDIEGIFGKRVIGPRFQYEWVEREDTGKVENTLRLNPPAPHGLKIVRGSAYGVFSRAFVEWLLSDQRAIDLLNWSRRTFSPDEIYWATLHHAFVNPQLKAPGSFYGHPNSKPWLAVYANWGERGCEGSYVRSVCVFGVGDLPALSRRHELFANKFFSRYQPITLDCIDQWIRHKEICPPSEDNFDYYRQLPFVYR